MKKNTSKLAIAIVAAVGSIAEAQQLSSQHLISEINPVNMQQQRLQHVAVVSHPHCCTGSATTQESRLVLPAKVKITKKKWHRNRGDTVIEVEVEMKDRLNRLIANAPVVLTADGSIIDEQLTNEVGKAASIVHLPAAGKLKLLRLRAYLRDDPDSSYSPEEFLMTRDIFDAGVSIFGAIQLSPKRQSANNRFSVNRLPFLNSFQMVIVQPEISISPIRTAHSTVNFYASVPFVAASIGESMLASTFPIPIPIPMGQSEGRAGIGDPELGLRYNLKNRLLGHFAHNGRGRLAGESLRLGSLATAISDGVSSLNGSIETRVPIGGAYAFARASDERPHPRNQNSDLGQVTASDTYRLVAGMGADDEDPPLSANVFFSYTRYGRRLLMDQVKKTQTVLMSQSIDRAVGFELHKWVGESRRVMLTGGASLGGIPKQKYLQLYAGLSLKLF